MPPPADSTRHDETPTLRGPDSAGATLGMEPPAEGIADSAPPTSVPDHELLRCIGRGAYGEVWLARNVMGSCRAVKIVAKSSFRDARPFEREFNGILKFEPLSRSHPGLVDVLQVGRNERCFYYVMELANDAVTGPQVDPDHYSPKTLRSELDARGRLPFDACVSIALALTEALGHMHAHGLIHRDIKPSNIIFVHDRPLLADIGLVADQSEAKSFVGTEGFIPPEGPGSAQGDLYSLGKVLYELATGRDRHEFPSLPTLTGDGQETGQSGMVELNAIILRACQPDPARRYASAHALRHDLLLLQGGGSVRRAHQVERRLTLLTRLSLVGSLATALILAAFYYVNQLRQRAERSEEAARRSLYAADMNLAFRALDEGNRGQAIQFLRNHQPAPGQSDLRGWEWRHLQERCRGDELATLGHHAKSVTVVRFFPDGATLAAITGDGAVELWDVATRTLTRSNHFQIRLNGLAVSPDGREIAISQDPGNIDLLDPASLAPRRRIETGQPVDALAYSPDGRLLAWAGIGGSICLVDRRDHRELHRFQARPTWSVVWRWGIAFSHDSRHFAYALASHDPGPTNSLVVWDCLHHREVARLPCPPSGQGLAVAFSPDGRHLAAGIRFESKLGVGRLMVWEWAKQTEVAHLPMDGSFVGSVAFSPDGSRLVASSRGQDLHVIETTTWTPVAVLQGHGFEPTSVDFSPDGRLLASGSKDCTIKLWNPLLRPERNLSWTLAGLKAVGAWSTYDGARVLIQDPATTHRWLDTRRAEVGPPWDCPVLTNRAWEISSDGYLAAVARSQGLVELWDLKHVELLRALSGAPVAVLNMDLSPDGRRLAVLKPAGAIEVWDTTSGQTVASLVSRRTHTGALALATDLDTLVVASDQGVMEIWDLIRREAR